MSHPLVSPALLRTLAFLGVTEALLYRLARPPAAGEGASSGVAASLHEGAGFAFTLAFLLSIAVLLNLAFRAARRPAWPGGLNTFLGICFVGLAAMGVSALAADAGPVLAIGFTSLSLVALMAIAMHAFAVLTPAWPRAFAVAYAAAALCSAASVVPAFLERLAWAPARRPELLVQAPRAGEVLLAAAGVLSFLAWAEARPGGAARIQAAVALVPAGMAGLGLAAASLMTAPETGLLGARPEAWRVLLLSSGLFLAVLTATLNLMSPRTRGVGYGLLFLTLAGFPLRIAHQDALMVIGAALLLAPPDGPPILLTAAPGGTREAEQAGPSGGPEAPGAVLPS
ncbi:MAG TPA: hypothetical protein VJV23_02185 [Candidatus Polarisedimenticolia bacterium]|nr:hypothetical protein [Candidatus Polarisedimenticolia bacterium]